MSRSSEKLELRVHRDEDSDDAILVSADGDENSAVWLPRSQVTRGRRTGRRDPIYMFDVPTWLAEEKGLL